MGVFNFHARLRSIRVSLLILTALLVPLSSWAQVAPPAPQSPPATLAGLIEAGRKQLQSARVAQTADAYLMAETLFDQAVRLDSASGLALGFRGAAKLERSGLLARQGDFGPAGKLMADAGLDMDAAVHLSPANWQVRMLRGMSYAQFPNFMGKGPTAAEDLEALIANPEFAKQPGPVRAAAHFQLGHVSVDLGQPDRARAAWLNSVSAAPDSTDGKAAKAALSKLGAGDSAHDSAGHPMPDRFPQLRDDVAPVIVSASFTLPGHNFTADDSTWHPRMLEFMKALAHQPGLTSMHRLVSLDHPGMLVILTWWKDKKALNDWFYSRGHQDIIQWIYGRGGEAQAQPTSSQTSQASQIAMELFTTLPGGMQFGGGIGPKIPPTPR